MRNNEKGRMATLRKKSSQRNERMNMGGRSLVKKIIK